MYMNVLAVINEEVKKLFENLEVYTIPELAQALSTHGHAPENIKILEKMLFDAYKRGGDPAVVDAYAEMAGVEIEALRNGRYVFHNLTGGGEPMLEIQDNANHCPDEMPS